MANSGSTSPVAEGGFYKFLKTLPKKSETTIRFFNRTDYYTVHEDDAEFVAKEVFKSTSNIKMFGTGKSLSLNKNQFESLVKDLLLVYHYRVEVYIPQGNTKSNDWVLEYKGSPGNLAQFEDLLFGTECIVGASVMGVKISGDGKNRVVGVATVDVAERLIALGEFTDDEVFTELEGLLVQIAPKEVLLPDTTEYKALHMVATRCGALVTSRKPGEFSIDGLTQDLNRLLHWKEGQVANCAALPELKFVTASAALNSLVKYLELAGGDTNFNQFTMGGLERARYVHVDTSAAKALGLITGPGVPDQQSLAGFLDRCRTPQGHRLLAQWVKQPLRDLRAISNRQDVIATLVDDPEVRVELNEEHLRRFPDLLLLVRRMQRKSASLQDCYKIYQAVERIAPLLEVLKKVEYCAGVRDTFVDRLSDLENDMAKFQEMVGSTLDMEHVNKGEFLVRPDFSEDLTELREKLNQLEEDMARELTRSSKELGMEAGKAIKLENNSQHGFYFRTANKKEEKQIRNHPQFTMIDANKTGIRFQTKALASHSREYLDCKRQYDECQRAIVEEIMNVAVGYVPSILSLNDVTARLDVLTSLALVAANAPTPYVRPTLLQPGSGVLRLRQARHPVLEVHDSVSFIPNDATLERDGVCFHVITGPNMGGKSTFIRTVGVSVLLAHIGSFVPCDEATVTLCDAMLARIGAGDCQMAGVSTFMQEMVETSAILRRATENSLVMIDELGRGTSTYEGCGLAWAIAKYLASEAKSFSLFATHFQELTALPDSVPSAGNLHVSAVAGENALTLLYQVRAGPSDRSFGLEVARMARFKPHVIEVARKKQVELEQRQGMGVTGVPLTGEEIEEGERLVLEFLRCLEKGGLGALDKAREQVVQHKNKYISAILS